MQQNGVVSAGRVLAIAAWVLGAGVFTATGLAQTSTKPEAMRPRSGEPAALPAKMTYPPTRTVEQVDEYHGVRVSDPFRWLEDDNAADTKAWVEAQNAVTFPFLERLPGREALQERLTGLWNFERYGVPFKEGGRYFLTRNDGLQNQSVLYVADSLTGEPRVLLDPNTLSKDGTVALSGYSVSENGKHLAWGMSDGGSDWQVWRVRDINTGQDLADELRWVKFSGASWAKDGSGFYYSRYDEPPPGDTLKGANYFQKLYFHKLGTPQSQDVLIYERPDQKEWGFSGNVTEDGRYLIITVWQGTDVRNRVFYKELGVPDAKVVELLNDFDASYDFVGNDGPVFWFKTDLDAPRSRVIAIDTRAPARQQWKEVIPQAEETLQGASVVGEHFLASYLKDARSEIRQFDLAGRLVRTVELPGIGTAGGFGGKRTDTETFYAFSGFTTPGTIFRYDVPSGRSEVFRQPKVDFDGSRYTTEQVFFRSKDGTKVPMFLVYRKGLKRDGNNPTLLYGYGGFNIPLTPGFSVARAVWLEMGGVFAMANLRGGGEYGKAWHDAGTKSNKQNVFDDFIGAAEYLIAEKWTSPARLAINGGSNGGLLVGAVMTQRPELFGAAVPAVGVMDMLRFHKFTIGWAWASDYGSADDPELFKTLYAYSPYHALLRRKACYPPTLITTADHDDRVVPAHSFKFAAALQAAQTCDNPVLIRIETRAGHGAGKPTAKQIEEWADVFAFLAHALRMDTAGLSSGGGG